MSRRHPALDIVIVTQRSPDPFADTLLAELDGFGPTAAEERPSGLRVYFATAAARARAADHLAASFGPRVSLSPIDVDDEAWAERSQASLRAIVIGAFTVTPPWDPAATGPRERTIVIQPSMGFGTGHHASTRLSLEALQRTPLAGRSVLDVGTGSGVLAIAGVKLGATRVTAIDSDADAIASARENLALNDAGDRVALAQADLREWSPSSADVDVVIANLTGELIKQLAGDLARLVAPGGRLVVSGFTESEEPGVVGALSPPLDAIERLAEADWVTVIFRNARA